MINPLYICVRNTPNKASASPACSHYSWHFLNWYNFSLLFAYFLCSPTPSDYKYHCLGKGKKKGKQCGPRGHEPAAYVTILNGCIVPVCLPWWFCETWYCVRWWNLSGDTAHLLNLWKSNTPRWCTISLFGRVDIAHNFDILAGFSISCCVTATPGRTGHISSGKSTPNVNQGKSKAIL